MVPLPASPAVCNSTTAAMEPGVSTDQRGVGLNAGGYCAAGNIDSGAVQTDYSIAFTTPPVSPVTTGSPMVPAPVVELLENARLVTADVSSPYNTVTISDSANELLSPFSTNVASLTSGAATFNSLVLATDQTNDTLTALLPLTSTINLTNTALVSSQSIVAPNFIWNPAGTII